MLRRAFLVVLLAAFSCATAGAARAEDYYVDQDGETVEFGTIYEGWFGNDRLPARYGRAIGENAAILALELFIYWYEPQSSIVDWQYPDLSSKLTNPVARFDDNMHRTNMLLHPMAGGAHYGISRVNGLGIPASFTAAALSSVLYEVVLEWKEIIGINDMIVTPIGGSAAGEFFFQLGNYLNSRQPRERTLDEVIGGKAFGREVASVTLGLPARVHQRIDQPRPAPPVAEDNLGFSSAYAHDFRLAAGGDVLYNDQGKSGGAAVIRARGELVAMPGFLRPGEIDTWFSNGNFTSLDARVAFDPRVRDFDIEFDSHLFGHFEQNIVAGPGGRSGLAHEIGARTGLRYVDRWLLDRRDHYAMVHTFGPVANLWALAGRSKLRLTFDVAPDFGPIRSLAYEEWVGERGSEGTKSSLMNHGYYHSFGISSGLAATLSIDPMVFELGGRAGWYQSIEGLDRFQENITEDVHLSDSIVELRGSIGFQPRRSPWVLSLDMGHFGRRSSMPPYRAARWDERVGGTVGVRF